MTALDLVTMNLVAILIPAVLLWLVSVALKDASIVDIFWGAAFVLVAWTTFLATDGHGLRKILILVPTTLWGLRLAGYLAWRNLGKGEDYRYRKLRENVGPSFSWRSLYMVFGLQALLIWIISMPIQLGQLGPAVAGPTPLQIIGLACFAIGLYFETVGDYQLARFKADPANQGKVMDQGLWRYTRHPNYFGDSMVAWGLFFLAIADFGSLLTLGWTVISPILMTLLLLYVSGVALLERSIGDRRPGYEEYIRRTSAFFPRRPKP